MLRFALKGALARKLRLALTATSIVLGVAFVAGTFVLTDTLNATFDKIFGDAEAGVSVVVRGQQAFAPGGFDASPAEERALVPDSVLRAVRAVPGVASAVGVVDGYTQLVHDGTAIVNGGAPNFGAAWVGASPTNPLHLHRGRAPQRPGEVLVDDKSFETFHLRLGDRVDAVVQTKTVPETIVGTVRFGSDSTLAGATMAAFVPAEAQRLLLGQAGVWSTVQAAAAPGVSQPVLRDRIASAVVGEHVDVLTEKDYVAQQSALFKKRLKFFNILLLVFAFIAVFVAVFIIYNTFTVLVAQRTRELALLRALGASRRQVLLAVVAEAGIVGIIAGVVGLLGGIVVAAGLRALISSVGAGLTTVALQVQPRTVVVSIAVGVVVTVAAALMPARRATRIPPVAAMRDDVALPSGSLRRRTRIGVAAVVLGAALLGVGIASGRPWQIGLGALGVFRGVTALSPLLSRPIVGGLGRLLPRLWGTPGRLARENALRNPRRTSATASALMIGIALTTTMSIMAASITTSATATIDSSVGADFILANKTFAPVPDTVAAAARRVPGVGAVTSFRSGSMRIGSTTESVTGVTAATVADTLRLTVADGALSTLATGELAVSKDAATSRHLHVGSPVAVTFALTGHRVLRVGAVYDTNPIAGKYLLGMSAYEANFRNRLDIVVAVKAASEQQLGSVRAGLAKVLAVTPTVQLRDQSEFKQDQKRQINQVLVFVLALLVLSLVIAWLGIVNTLALSVFERTREIGLLRAVGMATRQVRRMIRLEAVVIAVFGALLGVVLGLGYGAALVQALHSQGITTTAVPVGQLLGYLVVGVVAGVTAAWWPARRASKLDVLQAIATD